MAFIARPTALNPPETPQIDSALLARYLAGECAPGEQVAVTRWLESDPAHRHQLDTMRQAFDLAGARSAPTFDVDEMRHALAVQVSRDQGAARAFTPRRRRWPVPVAVSFAAAALVFVAFWVSARRPPAVEPVWREVVTQHSQRADVYLSDGTRVQLAPETRLRFASPMPDTARDVYLDGRALFTVTHDSLRPFRVRTSAGVAEDLGTRFDVRHYAGDTLLHVVVAEGLVALGQSAGTRDRPILRAGDRGTLAPSGLVEVRHGVDVSREIGWAAGRLSFEAIPLRDAIRELRRYYDREFVIADSALGSLRLTASFANEPASEVTRVIALTLELHYDVRGKTVTFSRRVPKRRVPHQDD